MAVTSSGTSTSQYQNHLDRTLLDKILPTLRLAKFAKRAMLPERTGSKAITWHRFGDPSTSNIVAVSTEGTTQPSTEKQLVLSNISSNLVQYMEYVSITDVLEATQLFDHRIEAVAALGEDFALHTDNLVRDELAGNNTGKNVVYATGSSYSGANAAVVTGAKLLAAATALKIDAAKPVDGSFVGLVSCEVAADIQRDSDFLDISKYSQPEGLFSGEIGRLHGIRWIETNNGYRSSTQYTYSASGAKYSTFVFGKDAYGVPDIASQSPFAPKVVFSEGADSGDVANLKNTIAMKAFYVAKTLQAKHVAEIYSGTNF